MANKSKAGALALVLVASAALIGGAVLLSRWRRQRNLPPPASFYAGLRGSVNPYTGAYMSAQQVTEMEWL